MFCSQVLLYCLWVARLSSSSLRRRDITYCICAKSAVKSTDALNNYHCIGQACIDSYPGNGLLLNFILLPGRFCVFFPKRKCVCELPFISVSDC